MSAYECILKGLREEAGITPESLLATPFPAHAGDIASEWQTIAVLWFDRVNHLVCASQWPAHRVEATTIAMYRVISVAQCVEGLVAAVRTTSSLSKSIEQLPAGHSTKKEESSVFELHRHVLSAACACLLHHNVVNDTVTTVAIREALPSLVVDAYIQHALVCGGGADASSAVSKRLAKRRAQAKLPEDAPLPFHTISDLVTEHASHVAWGALLIGGWLEGHASATACVRAAQVAFANPHIPDGRSLATSAHVVKHITDDMCATLAAVCLCCPGFANMLCKHTAFLAEVTGAAAVSGGAGSSPTLAPASFMWCAAAIGGAIGFSVPMYMRHITQACRKDADSATFPSRMDGAVRAVAAPAVMDVIMSRATVVTSLHCKRAYAGILTCMRELDDDAALYIEARRRAEKANSPCCGSCIVC